MTRARIGTGVEVGLSVVLLAVGAVALAARPTIGAAAYFAVAVAVAVLTSLLAWLVVRHAPDNLVGPVLGFAGVVALLTATTDLYAAAAAAGTVPLSPYVVAFTQGSWMLLYLPFAALLLWFPDGVLLGPRWRLVPVGLALVVVGFDVALGFADVAYVSPFEDLARPVPAVPGAFWVAMGMLPVFLVLLVAAVAAVVVRARRSTGKERQQLRWLLLASASLPLTLLLCWLSYLLLGSADLALVGLLVMYVAFPAAATVAVLRHDLYDVDRAVVLTAVYGLIGTALLLVFTTVSVVAGLLAIGASDLLAVVLTAGSGVLLGTARSRLTRWVGTRLDPARERVRTALADLDNRVRRAEAVPEQLEPTLRTALRDPGLRVGHLAPDRAGLVDRDGRVVEATDGSEPVTVAGSRVGALVPGRRVSAGLLRYAAAESGPLVDNARLRLELAAALREVAASRERLVRASDEERRRLELDLHDGAQQRLVSLGMSLRLAQRHLGDGTVEVDAVIDQAVAELGTAVSELRQLAHGLRPSSLDDGLAAALANLARGTPVPVKLDVRSPELPEHLSTTAYFVASEALANAVKHAEAAAVGLTVVQQDGEVHVAVSDDGCGGATVRPGSGLAGLRDRVHAVGGRLDVVSGPGEGTVVEAVLPCGS